MTYATVTEFQKHTGYLHGASDSGGIQAQLLTTANLKIKSRILKAGITPPASDDSLKAAEIEMAIAYHIRRLRLDGSMPKGEGSFDTYDSINKAIKLHETDAWDIVDSYISQYAAVAPSSTTGVSRSDYVINDFKLDQGAIAEPTDIDGESLAEDQRS